MIVQVGIISVFMGVSCYNHFKIGCSFWSLFVKWFFFISKRLFLDFNAVGGKWVESGKSVDERQFDSSDRPYFLAREMKKCVWNFQPPIQPYLIRYLLEKFPRCLRIRKIRIC